MATSQPAAAPGTSRAACAGWDVGGSHLKLALCDKQGEYLEAWQLPLPLWRGLEHLEAAFDQAWSLLKAEQERAGERQPPLRHALTLTAELCDIFPDREQGVRTVLKLLAPRFGPGLRIYTRQGFRTPEQACRRPSQTASANWHATLHYAAACRPAGILIDIGGTTTDLLPFADGAGLQRGQDDASRMLHGELIYSGVVRTTVAAVARHLPVAGEWAPVAAEHFADMADVYRLSGELPAAADLLPSADGAGKDAHAAARRLARLCGRDLPKPGALQPWRHAARHAAELQLRSFQDTLARLLARPELAEPLHQAPLVAAGTGAFLVPELARRCGREAQPLLTGDPPALSCASAAAVAALAIGEDL